MKKVIVFGGGGFIGGHLSKRLKNIVAMSDI
jgi:nucleoside-diphosphate-sugar epimerase